MNTSCLSSRAVGVILQKFSLKTFKVIVKHATNDNIIQSQQNMKIQHSKIMEKS